MSWILITFFAQFLIAITATVDKYFVSNTKLKPISYTFYVGIFQIFYIILIVFYGFRAPEFKYLFLGLFSGALFIFALIVFYKALKISDTSRIVSIIGAAIPIFTASLSYIIINEKLAKFQMLSFIFLVLGGSLISSKFSKGKMEFAKGTTLAILAGFLFSSYYTSVKLLYLHTSFIDGFILIQLGGFLGAALLLVSKKNRREIFNAEKQTSRNNTILFASNKLTAAFAAFLISYAISIKESNVAIINALHSVQFVFILLFAIIFSKTLPKLFCEHLNKKVIMQKIMSIILIAIGLYLLKY